MKQLKIKLLLTEEVFGGEAFVYHGSRLSPEQFIPIFLNKKFEPGQGAGAMYGKGLYTVYSLDNTKTLSGGYGNYIYKFKVNLHEFIVFDPNIALLVYKKPLKPSEQARLLNLNSKIIKLLQRIEEKSHDMTSDMAIQASSFLKGTVKGIIFSGRIDGEVAVIYDANVATLISYTNLKENNEQIIWNKLDKELIKNYIRTNNETDYNRYNQKNLATKNLFKILTFNDKSPEERVIEDEFNYFESFALLRKLTQNNLKFLEKFKYEEYFSWFTGFTLPESIRFKENVIFFTNRHVDKDFINSFNMPNNMTVDKTLFISQMPYEDLPKGLTVNTLQASHTPKRFIIPPDFKCNNLIGEKSNFIFDPTIENFKADGNIIITENKNLKALPNNLAVGGSLLLNDNIRLKTLPENLTVGIDLDITGTKILTLPESLKVGGRIIGFKANLKKAPLHLREKLFIEFLRSSKASK